MIVIQRGLARSFRILARKCVSGRPRGPAPPVVIESKAGTLTAWVNAGDAALAYAAPAAGGGGDELVVVPMAVLGAVEGAGDDPVELAVGSKLRGVARWADRGVPRTYLFDAIIPGKHHRPPTVPAEWHAVTAEFLAALHACGRTAAKEAVRLALHRVQVRGRAGQVVGTDARAALVWGGFTLPFADDLLVPAVPVFGNREFAAAGEVKVGRTAHDLVVAAGPWRVVLPVDHAGKYPDVAGVIPRHLPTVSGIDDADAAALAGVLAGLPGGGDESHPVTLDLDGGVVARGRDGESGRADEVRLPRSPSAGPAVRVAVDRTVLARALALGCLTIRAGPDKPVVFEGGNKTFVAITLDPSLVAGPAADADGQLATAPPSNPEPPERTLTVKPHESNGHAPNGRPDPPRGDPDDPLAEAEALRAALGDALTRVARLTAALKAQRREKKALTQAWSSLKALNLGTGGRP